eukprot:216923-Hanusia_phi.AAC.1
MEDMPPEVYLLPISIFKMLVRRGPSIHCTSFIRNFTWTLLPGDVTGREGTAASFHAMASIDKNFYLSGTLLDHWIGQLTSGAVFLDTETSTWTFAWPGGGTDPTSTDPPRDGVSQRVCGTQDQRLIQQSASARA